MEILLFLVACLKFLQNKQNNSNSMSHTAYLLLIGNYGTFAPSLTKITDILFIFLTSMLNIGYTAFFITKKGTKPHF